MQFRRHRHQDTNTFPTQLTCFFDGPGLFLLTKKILFLLWGVREKAGKELSTLRCKRKEEWSRDKTVGMM
jgi:hypothetical protein